MKHIFLIAVILMIFYNSSAQSKKLRQVETSVNSLIKAMEDGDVAVLNRIAANELTYGHSGGKVENKQEFINAFATGASDFIKITITDQTINVIKNIAVVRHTLEADTNDNNKAGHVKLKILTVWKKMGGAWRLIARQAVKPPAN